MDAVRVHRQSPKPAAVQALAYTQGTNIYLGTGQDHQLPHEAWHVVQQMQNRVRSTFQCNGQAINSDRALEQEADVMGKKAAQIPPRGPSLGLLPRAIVPSPSQRPIQRALATLADVDPNNLNPHKTALNAANVSVGRGANTTTPGRALTTRITWGAVHAKTGEGTGVEANPLGPDHPLGSKTSGNKGIGVRVKAFNKAFVGDWKQGHLLNAHLGGPGDEAKNLVAISQSTNSRMSGEFEDDLQKRINENGEWMHFKVVVTHKAFTDDDTIEAIDEHLYDDQFFWAKTLKVEWGSVDADGNKTGTSKRITLTAGEPVARSTKGSAPKTTGDAKGNFAASAMTTIGDEDIVLDSQENVATQVEQKTAARAMRLAQNAAQVDDEVMTELEAPPTPFRGQEHVDEPLALKYPEYKPMSDYQGEGRYIQWHRANRAVRKRLGDSEPYNTDLRDNLRSAKREPERAVPMRLGTLLKNNITNTKLNQALSDARAVWSELGTQVEQYKGMFTLGFMTPKDFARFVEDFYRADGKRFQKYTNTLDTSLK